MLHADTTSGHIAQYLEDTLTVHKLHIVLIIIIYYIIILLLSELII